MIKQTFKSLRAHLHTNTTDISGHITVLGPGTETLSALVSTSVKWEGGS